MAKFTAEKTVMPGDLSITPLRISPSLLTLSSVSLHSGKGGSEHYLPSAARLKL